MENFYEKIITFVASLTIAYISGQFASREYWKKKEIDVIAEYSSRFNTKKWEVYTEFTRLVPLIMGNESEIIKIQANSVSLESLAPQIVLAGSDEVVKALRVWLETTCTYGQGDNISKDKLFKLIVEMRKDLGNEYTQLEKDDLLGTLNPLS